MINDIESVKELERMIEVVVRSLPKEREARDLYRAASESATMEMTKRLFAKLAEQEQEHEKKLSAVLDLLQKELRQLLGGG
jgi:rubrerythrin